jgi:bla regulator protein BlaR1
MTDLAAALALSLSASPEAALLFKVTLALVAGLVAVRLAARARASVRHAALAASLAATLILPAVVAFVPAVDVPIGRPATALRGAVATSQVGPVTTDVAASAQAPPIEDSRTLSPRAALTGVWIAGALVAAAPFAAALWRLREMRRRALPWPAAQSLVQRMSGFRHTATVAIDPSVVAPLTFGVLRPVIILPVAVHEWPAPALERALVHELAHARRGDWWTHAMARLACAIYWFHPLVWSVSRRLALEAERACDDEVLARGEEASYADQLVALARSMNERATSPLLGMANRSDLSTRVAAALDPSLRRGPMRAAQVALIGGLTVSALITVAPVRVVGRAAADVVSETPAEAAAQASRRGSRLNRALVEAAEDGDIADVQDLLERGADVNAAVDGDGSPLIAAARSGSRALVTLLLDRGADVNLAVEGDGNPLIMAAAEGHAAIVELLLARGADVNTVVPSDETALIQASGNGHLAIVQLLVARGADVNIRVWAEQTRHRDGGEWRTALWAARRGNHRQVVEYLVSVGAQ